MKERIWIRVAPRDCVSDACGLLHDERVFCSPTGVNCVSVLFNSESSSVRQRACFFFSASASEQSFPTVFFSCRAGRDEFLFCSFPLFFTGGVREGEEDFSHLSSPSTNCSLSVSFRFCQYSQISQLNKRLLKLILSVGDLNSNCSK